jgi:hypothetical protein
MSPKIENLIQSESDVRRMQDILSMGLHRGDEVAVDLVSAGITVEHLFGAAAY